VEGVEEAGGGEYSDQLLGCGMLCVRRVLFLYGHQCLDLDLRPKLVDTARLCSRRPVNNRRRGMMWNTSTQCLGYESFAEEDINQGA
jgi:hypothetical protein